MDINKIITDSFDEFKKLPLKDKLGYIVHIFAIISFIALIIGFLITYSYLNSEHIPFSSFSGNESIVSLILFFILFIFIIFLFFPALFYHSNIVIQKNSKKDTAIYSFIIFIAYTPVMALIFLFIPMYYIKSEAYKWTYIIIIPGILFLILLFRLFTLIKNKFKGIKNNPANGSQKIFILILFIIPTLFGLLITFYKPTNSLEKWVILSTLGSIFLFNLLFTYFYNSENTTNTHKQVRIGTVILTSITLFIIFIIFIYPSNKNTNKFIKSSIINYNKFRTGILGLPLYILSKGGNIPIRIDLKTSYYKKLQSSCYIKNKNRQLEICKGCPCRNQIYGNLILVTSNGYYIHYYYNSKNNSKISNKILFIPKRYTEQSHFWVKKPGTTNGSIKKPTTNNKSIKTISPNNERDHGMDMKFIYIIITAFLTSFGYYLVSWILEKKKTKNRLFLLLASIRSELLALKDREHEIIGNIIGEAKKNKDYPLKLVPLIGLTKPSFEYFIIYDNSSYELIGLIGNKNKTLAENIAKVYLLAKSYYDEMILLPEWDKIRTDPTDYFKTHEVGKITYIKDHVIIDYFNNRILTDREALMKTIETVVAEINRILK